MKIKDDPEMLSGIKSAAAWWTDNMRCEKAAHNSSFWNRGHWEERYCPGQAGRESFQSALEAEILVYCELLFFTGAPSISYRAMKELLQKALVKCGLEHNHSWHFPYGKVTQIASGCANIVEASPELFIFDPFETYRPYGLHHGLRYESEPAHRQEAFADFVSFAKAYSKGQQTIGAKSKQQRRAPEKQKRGRSK